VRALPPALVLLALLAGCGGGSDDGGSNGSSAEPATFAEVQQIVERRCFACHSPNPTIEGYEQAGLIDFSKPENIEQNKHAIHQAVVVQKRMPFNDNATGMTQEERDRIASWAEAATS
jgi:uncharacterized membrane protein